MTSQHTPDHDLVWYASYGSNLDRARFLAYIEGTPAPENTHRHRGARDRSLPRDDRPIEVPHQLFFAGSSRLWGGGGVAFLDRNRGKTNARLRAYLITREQFADVFAQENGRPFESIDLGEIRSGDTRLIGDRWYALILCCGMIDGLPVVTFTSPKSIEECSVASPSGPYLRRLARGLERSHDLDRNEVVDYLLHCPGVAQGWSTTSLRRAIEQRP